jgi:hypothetical protein
MNRCRKKVQARIFVICFLLFVDLSTIQTHSLHRYQLRVLIFLYRSQTPQRKWDRMPRTWWRFWQENWSRRRSGREVTGRRRLFTGSKMISLLTKTISHKVGTICMYVKLYFNTLIFLTFGCLQQQTQQEVTRNYFRNNSDHGRI